MSLVPKKLNPGKVGLHLLFGTFATIFLDIDSEMQ